MKVKAWAIAAAISMIAGTAAAEYEPSVVPSVCAPTKEVLDDLRQDGFKVWAASRIVQDNMSLTLLIWRKDDSELTVTTHRSGSALTCIIGMGDTDTVILDWDKVRKTF